jgi:hypothetical protein
MNLAALRLEVRYVLDDLLAQYWSDQEINIWLNEGAKTMCTRSQTLNSAIQMPAIPLQQEYILPRDVDEVTNVTFSQGMLIKVHFMDQRKIQRFWAGGIPNYYYTRFGTLQTMNLTSQSNITVAPANTSQSKKPEYILGIYPVPTNSNPITVSYKARHYDMDLDLDEPAIPEEFQRGIIYYAVALGKMREEAYEEAKENQALFSAYAQSCKEKMDNQGQEDILPRMNVPNTRRSSPFEGSSWVYIGDAGGNL